ncbi:MAG: UDP-3-O-[3-hydroxymyristoyl] N-acetylglucosamine deacetylase [Rickettsiales bacterium]|nr:UDP-3-O-[3-hydroxymyristoyl] N-acetylglucosamine deacetylase [Rickettsiales bacterium]
MKNFQQVTIQRPLKFSGIGIHSGKVSNVIISPADPDTGITFKRTDIQDPKKSIIKAKFDNVISTKLGTSLTNEYGVKVSTIEHLMAGLWGASIDNCLIEIDNEEIPVFDGSCEPFMFIVECAGLTNQYNLKKFLKIKDKIEYQETDSHGKEINCSLEPDRGFSVELSIDFENKVIGSQDFNFSYLDNDFKTSISRARTFGLESEVQMMNKMGLGLGGSLDNAIVVGETEILNPEGLRFNNEFVRHKILDSIGDLYLSGYPILGKFKGFRSGHTANNKLLHNLFSDPSSYEIIEVVN